MSDSTMAAASPRRKRRSPLEIRQRLLDAAKQEFKADGHKATTAAIAARADVTEGQLYRYFESKDDLLRDAIFEPLNQKLSEFGTTYLADITGMEEKKDRMRAFISGLQELIGKNPEMFTALMLFKPGKQTSSSSNTELDALQTCFDMGSAMLKTRLNSGNELDTRLLAKTLFASVLGAVAFREWIFPEYSEDSDALIDVIGEFMIGNLLLGNVHARDYQV